MLTFKFYWYLYLSEYLALNILISLLLSKKKNSEKI